MSYLVQTNTNKIMKPEQIIEVSLWGQKQRYWQDGKAIELPRKCVNLRNFEVVGVYVEVNSERFHLPYQTKYSKVISFNINPLKIGMPLGEYNATILLKKGKGKPQEIKVKLINFVDGKPKKKRNKK